jgi:hypothetical protein
VLRLPLLALVAAASACATTLPVRPIGRGNTAFNASVGGPMVQALGADIPAPILTVGGAYGARDDTEVTVRADLTAAAYGDLHLQPGAAYHTPLRAGDGAPILTAAPSLHLITNFTDTRVYPQLTLASAWLIRRRHSVYVGADTGVGFGTRTRVIAGPLVGGELRAGRLGITLEGKWLAPYYDVAPTAPSWISPFGHGYLTVLVGVTYYLGFSP